MPSKSRGNPVSDTSGARPRRPSCCLLWCCLFLPLVACGSSGASPAAVASATPSPSATPSIPTLSTPLVTYRGHTGPVISAAWSPDGKRLASCGNDGVVQVWNAETGQMLWQTPITRFAFAVAWSPNGREVAGAGSGGVLVLLDATTGYLLKTFVGQAGAVEGLAWSPDGTRIASGGQDDHTVKVWDVRTGEALVTYAGHSDSVERVAWSPDGTRIASASYDGTVQVWEARTGRKRLTYSDQGAPVWEVAWSPDGTRIVSGTGAAGAHGPVTANNSVKVWDAATGQTLLSYAGSTGQAYALARSHDGQRIASG